MDESLRVLYYLYLKYISLVNVVLTQVVSKRDIDGFFEEMQARKRPKLESGDGVPPHHCHF